VAPACAILSLAEVLISEVVRYSRCASRTAACRSASTASPCTAAAWR
jgi:hypothetical protein